MASTRDWARAIATRVADEWGGRQEFPEDAELLRQVLSTALAAHPAQCRRLIGTGIIEADYFEPLG